MGNLFQPEILWSNIYCRSDGGSSDNSGDRKGISRAAQVFYKNLWSMKENAICVWTGQKINSVAGCHLDHVIPFSIWKNNELWNLMPTLPEVNGKKSDKIPSMKLLDLRKEAIIHFWDLICGEIIRSSSKKQSDVSLVGRAFFLISPYGREQAFDALKEKCRYLIEIRGFTEWDLLRSFFVKSNMIELFLKK